MSIPVVQSSTVTFTASLTATAEIGPSRYGENWKVTRVVCTANTDNDPTLLMYMNAASDSSIIGGTYSGKLDSSDENIPLSYGEKLVFVWTDGQLARQATVIVYGERE